MNNINIIMSSVTDTNIEDTKPDNLNSRDDTGLNVDIIRNKQFDFIMNKLIMFVKTIGRYIISLVTILMYLIKMTMTFITKRVETIMINHIERNKERHFYKKLVDGLCYKYGFINNNILGLYVRAKEIVNKYNEIAIIFLVRYSDENVITNFMNRIRDQ
jgi:hypothetical protein